MLRPGDSYNLSSSGLAQNKEVNLDLKFLEWFSGFTDAVPGAG
jgi:hypothetical protein